MSECMPEILPETHAAPNLSALPVPAFILDPRADLIAAANSEADRLFGGPLAGRRFAPLVRASAGELIVFSDAVSHYGAYWTRKLATRTLADEPLDLEYRARVLSGGDQLRFLMVALDLRDLETHTEQVEAARIHESGLFHWQRAQAFFRELEYQNQLILNAAGEGIYGVNADGKTTFVNRAAQEMLGWTAEDLIGRDIHARIHHHHLTGEVYPARECPIYRSFRNEQVSRVDDEVFWRKDGKPIRVEYISTPIYDQQVLAGAVVIFRDITERKENEARLRAALAEVDALKERLEQENAYLQDEILSERAHHDLVGQSPAILGIAKQVDLVGPTDANVMIWGESGTGKSLVAAAIHKASARRRRPLVRINCAALSAADFDSEMFGHVRGAFPGALRDRTGKLDIANGGTIYLDQVTELPVEAQGKLLQALREGRFERLGEGRERRVNVRVIASSSRRPDEVRASSEFREDLFFQLNVVPILCPPLRDRIEDVEPLTWHFIRLTARRLNLPQPLVSEAVMKRLQSWHWPGNARELSNVIEHGMILARGDKLYLSLPGETDGRPGADPAPIVTEEARRQRDLDNLRACLRRANGKVAGPDGAAAMMGIKPATLYSRLRRSGLSRTGF